MQGVFDGSFFTLKGLSSPSFHCFCSKTDDISHPSWKVQTNVSSMISAVVKQKLITEGLYLKD